MAEQDILKLCIAIDMLGKEELKMEEEFLKVAILWNNILGVNSLERK